MQTSVVVVLAQLNFGHPSFCHEYILRPENVLHEDKEGRRHHETQFDKLFLIYFADVEVGVYQETRNPAAQHDDTRFQVDFGTRDETVVLLVKLLVYPDNLFHQSGVIISR